MNFGLRQVGEVEAMARSVGQSGQFCVGKHFAVRGHLLDTAVKQVVSNRFDGMFNGRVLDPVSRIDIASVLVAMLQQLSLIHI